MNTFERMKDSQVKEAYLQSVRRKFRQEPERYERLTTYVRSPEFDGKLDDLNRGVYNISIPEKHAVIKMETNKKRTVFTFEEEDRFLFSFLSFMLHKYDERFSPCLHSYIKGRTVKDLLWKVNGLRKQGYVYGYKIDIKSYGENIGAEPLAEKLGDIIDDDPELLKFLRFMLLRGEYYEKGVFHNDGTGSLMGYSVHSFMMNLFLEDVDRRFEKEAPFYARYVDDILILCKSRQQAEELGTGYIEELKVKGLKLNEKKTSVILPEDSLVYLGIILRDDDVIDISPFTIDKMKRRTRIRGRRYRRAVLNGKMTKEEATKAYFDITNSALFGQEIGEEFNGRDAGFVERYAYIINTTESLHKLDRYVQLYARYISTGKFRAKNWSITYEDLKKLGYRSCVRDYYTFRYRKDCVEQDSTR